MGRWQETVGEGFSTGLLWGTTKTWEVLNENTGRVGGTQTEHWDDSLDAHVFLEPVYRKMFPQEMSPDQRLEWALEELKKVGVVPPKELWQ